jgi:hypothetical protein
MKIAVILESGADNELDRAEITVPNDDEDAVEDAVKEVLEDWKLRVGDIVRVVELPIKEV